MAYFEGADWIAIVTLAGATGAGLVGAWLTHRRPPKVDAADEPGKIVVDLSPHDREIVGRLIDTIYRGVTRFEDACQQLRHAILDNSDHVKRNNEKD